MDDVLELQRVAGLDFLLRNLCLKGTRNTPTVRLSRLRA